MLVRCSLGSLLVLASGCSSSAAPPRAPQAQVDQTALCAELAALVEAAPKNFADQRTDTAVRRDNQDGVAAGRAVSGTLGCMILRPDPAYPDDLFECDLAAAGPRAAADAVLTAWRPRVAACPVVAGWHQDEGPGAAAAWQYETDDNHQLEVELDVSGDEPALVPVLRVRRPEI